MYGNNKSYFQCVFYILSIYLFFAGTTIYAASPTFIDQYPDAKAFFPKASYFSELSGDPPVSSVYQNDTIIGYVFVSVQIAKIPAYSGKPVNLLIAIDTKANIIGSKVLSHSEPILLVGIPETRLQAFIDQYNGHNVAEKIKVGAGSNQSEYVNVDAITGATVTVVVVNETILRAARKVASSLGLIKGIVEEQIATVRQEIFSPAAWDALRANNSIQNLYLNKGKVEQAFIGTPAEQEQALTKAQQKETFIDLYFTYLNTPTTGKNVLGESQYQWLMGELKEGEHAIAVMANGEYSFKGSGFVRGGIFDRIQLSQNDKTITFHDLDYYRLSDVYAQGMPEFNEMAIFIIRAGHEFNPGLAWSFELLVRKQTGPLDSVFSSFEQTYQLPEAWIKYPVSVTPDIQEETPIWVTVWQDKKFALGILLLSLVFLSLILIFQDWLVRHPTLLSYVRDGFLLYTIIFIGWYALAQLSVVNVLTFLGALQHSFSWDTFLIDPFMFILWSYVAVTLLLWGRGVYCGWLCPFGAIQELVNQVARYFKVRQWEFPEVVHERLWALKYIILLILFAISLQSLATAEHYAEIEPFKTVISLHFQREWGFLIYAIALILISIVNRKFYCKYLCPLGAALAIPARLSLFDWLRRYKECGNPCQICANECEVRAIDTRGRINVNECHYCLDCQVTYWNDQKCPPVILHRKKRERLEQGRKK